jgi:hypothetical protein
MSDNREDGARRRPMIREHLAEFLRLKVVADMKMMKEADPFSLKAESA